ncbi:hypothetical protein M422DRAFT_126587, partial [Sphaerobolus stellatus SS14]
PRPSNAWILYRSAQFKLLILEYEKHPSKTRPTQVEFSKIIGNMWKTASPEVKEHYNDLALKKKEEHEALHPGYRFKPIKKEEK